MLLAAIVGIAAYRLLATPAPDIGAPSETADEASDPSEAPSDRERVAGRSRRPRPKPSQPRPSRPGRPADFTELAREVADVRGLSIREKLRARVTSDRQLADKISELAQEDLVVAEVEADERLLVALRLAPRDIELIDVLDALYREQILGVYVPEESTLYVKHGPRSLSPLGAVTAAHEITHALQDQHFNLDKMRADVEDDADASLAVLSLIEGDAVLTQQRWAAEHLTESELSEAQAESAGSGSDALDQTPPYLRNSLFFPYSEGVQFVAEVSESRDIDDIFRDPPTSTEHILHPDKYLAGDEPETVSLPRTPGQGWKRSTDYEFGEFDLAELFANLGEDTAASVGDGWDGGRVRSWTQGRDTAVAARLVFDSGDDADQACEALPQWYADVADGRDAGDGVLEGDHDVMAYRCDGSSVRFALAPDAATARRLAGR